MPRGRPRKSIEEHELAGTLRHARHNHGAALLVASKLVPSRVPTRDRSLVPKDLSEQTAKKWAHNSIDEMAIAKGYRFDEERAEFTAKWIETRCRLYEGEYAGQFMRLHDWQLEGNFQIFGWVRWSTRWNRWIRRFRRVRIWISKKNKKTPTLAAWGLHLHTGDGEPGQKVFSGARDGKQAGIAHTHATEMAEWFPEFEEEFGINGTTRKIFHKPSRSTYEILTVDSGGGDGKEGINGSLMIDESHVVDRKFARIIKRAGISRSEPIEIAVSTAGNDPDCWGKDQYDFGKRVAQGEFPIFDYLHMSYEAPQDTKDEDLQDREKLIELGKAANPAWGHTIDPEEFVADYEESSTSLSELGSFKQYRLNIWQQSVNPWLPLDAWRACERDYSAADLEGRECWTGIDLAAVRDMNAISLCFPDGPDAYAFLWWFFLPAETVRKLADKVPFEEMARDSRANLIITPGSAVGHEWVMKTYRELCQRFDVRQLNFDGWAAELPTRALSEGMEIDGEVLFEGTGVPRTVFGQGPAFFNEPSKAFERLLLEEKIFHNGDPVITWQIGHVAARRDVNDNIKPEKPGGKDDYRKVDGVIAAVMALAAAMNRNTTASAYDDPDQGMVVI